MSVKDENFPRAQGVLRGKFGPQRYWRAFFLQLGEPTGVLLGPKGGFPLPEGFVFGR